jgi:hypothetical protein
MQLFEAACALIRTTARLGIGKHAIVAVRLGTMTFKLVLAYLYDLQKHMPIIRYLLALWLYFSPPVQVGLLCLTSSLTTACVLSAIWLKCALDPQVPLIMR